MDEQEARLGPAGRIGGALCLDFVNTVDWPGRAQPSERLRTYADLARWAQFGGALTGDQADAAIPTGAAAPERARETLEQARALRAALYRIFSAVTRHDAPAPADLATLNGWIGTALAQGCLTVTDGGFAWGWQDAPDRLDAPLWPVARSAVDLLTGPALPRVHQCADAECGWFFLDVSKNGSRRWCSMDGCGSRAKARQYYQRQQAARAR
jgi:predicted RNA-binding Zn ribbon-like protein